MSYTVKDVEYACVPEGLHGNAVWGNLSSGGTVTIPVLQSMPLEVVDSSLGGEGDYSKPVYIVFSLMSPDGSARYFKKTGHYESFEGTTWDGALVEVHPSQKTVTVYEETLDYNYDSFDDFRSF